MKASVVERFNRTLKSKLEKYFYENHTKDWYTVLEQFVDNYNKTPHRSIGMAPNQVNDANASVVFKKMFPDIQLQSKPRLAVGNIVRKIKHKTYFEKGYTRNWSEECYRVKVVKQAAGRVWYLIETMNGVLVPGIKYFWQLNLVASQ